MTTLTEPSAARGENELTQRWSRWTYWPLAIAAAVFLITYTLHVIGDVEGGVFVATTITIWVIWAMFITDYFVRLRLSHPRRLWFRTHKLDLVLAFVPALRPIRLLDAFTRIASFTRTTGNSIRARLLIYGVGAALLLVWYISLIVLQAERHAPGATITTFPQRRVVGLLHRDDGGVRGLRAHHPARPVRGGVPDGRRRRRGRPRRGHHLVVGRGACLSRAR